MHSISLDVTLSDSERKITTRIRQKDLIYKDHKPLKMCRIQGINHGLGTSRNIKRLFLIENWVSYIKRDAPRSRSGLGKFRDPDSGFSESLDKGWNHVREWTGNIRILQILPCRFDRKFNLGLIVLPEGLSFRYYKILTEKKIQCLLLELLRTALSNKQITKGK